MKKGMKVTLDNGKSFILVDSLSYENNKYFAAVSEDENNKALYFFIGNSESNVLTFIDESTNEKVISALRNHISTTFKQDAEMQ